MRTIFFTLMALICVVAQAADTTIASRDAREIKMAEQAVLWSLISANSTEGRRLCSESQLGCSDDRAELGLVILAGKRSNSALESLAAILRYRIDAGISESYTCEILNRGRRISPWLQRVSPGKLNIQCVNELQLVKQSDGKALGEVNQEEICSDEKQIENRIKDLLASIAKGRKCSPDDY